MEKERTRVAQELTKANAKGFPKKKNYHFMVRKNKVNLSLLALSKQKFLKPRILKRKREKEKKSQRPGLRSLFPFSLFSNK